MSSPAYLYEGPGNYAIGSVWAGGSLVSKGEICYPRFYNGFAYKSITAGSPRTGSTEPDWPTTAGSTVVDGEVTWQAFTLETITWKVRALHTTDGVEPAWPTAVNGTVTDGTITWVCQVPVIDDAACPHSAAVLWASSKLFAANDDVVRYSATSNPLGWTASIYPKDAGFLATGDQMVGDPQAVALAQYRGNLAVLGYSTTQIWQLDPDPARIVLIDTIEGVGTPWPRAHASVMGDLFFLSAQGVRSLGVSIAAGGIAETDVGSMIDELVKAKLASLGAGANPIGLFVPGLGEYWLILGDRVYVLRQSKVAQMAAWAEYRFPWAITDAAVMGNDLYLMVESTATIYKVDRSVYTDDGTAITVAGETAYIDLGDGRDAMTLAIECIASAAFSAQVRYSEKDETRVTTATAMPAKTRSDGMIPVHLNGIPSAALVFSHSANEPFELTKLELVFEPLGTR